MTGVLAQTFGINQWGDRILTGWCNASECYMLVSSPPNLFDLAGNLRDCIQRVECMRGFWCPLFTYKYCGTSHLFFKKKPTLMCTLCEWWTAAACCSHNWHQSLCSLLLSSWAFVSLVSPWVSALILAGQLWLGCMYRNTSCRPLRCTCSFCPILLSASANTFSGALLAATICCADTLSEEVHSGWKTAEPSWPKEPKKKQHRCFFVLEPLQALQQFSLSV